MWPFSNKVTLSDSGIFQGFTDWHSHILPGVDDGVKTMDESLHILNEYEKSGFKKVWLTPHIMEDYPNTTSELRENFENLKSNWHGNMEIALASENMLDNLFEQRLEKNDFLPIGEQGDHLLVETSYYTAPYAMQDMLNAAKALGYYIILAHPERYQYMDEKYYMQLKEMGIKFQLNILSLIGMYGTIAKKKAEYLVSKSFIDYLGTDIHRKESIGFHNMERVSASLISRLK